MPKGKKVYFSHFFIYNQTKEKKKKAFTFFFSLKHWEKVKPCLVTFFENSSEKNSV